MARDFSFPFPLDRFQKESIAHLEQNRSVLVSAPTGAGKTVIAECVIEKARQAGEGVIYTAPIKALSNQKYRDFRQRFPGEVGIVTGDVSIEPDAPIVIMTTEIYRNSLFENSERISRTGWVIFDEIHYLNDPQRGTVWEEAILFTPPHIRTLALSATVPNVDEIAEWMRKVHEIPIEVVRETHRPVPLDFRFQCQGVFFDGKKQLLREGYRNRADWSNLRRHQGRRGMRSARPRPNRLDTMLSNLKRESHLPCIYFVFGRKRAEYLAYDSMLFNFLKPGEKQEVAAHYDRLLERYQLQDELSAQELRPLIELGIAFHHAGMLPSLKEVVEQLFTSRMLKLIFTTETFALGINMPARAVIFDELQKYYGDGFRNLTTRDFFQMAGRAGRRGMDEQGYVYIRVNPLHISYKDLTRILYGEPEPITSQFNAAYATLLNLFREMKHDLLRIYPESLHYFQSSKKRRREAKRLIERKLLLLEELDFINSEGLTAKGEFASSLFGYEMILSQMREDGILEELDPYRLCILLSAFVFEPRKDDRAPKLSPQVRDLARRAEHFYRQVHMKEVKYRITPLTRPPHFHIAGAVEAWARGTDFDSLFRLTKIDEGELVRNFRMIIQLLRELRYAPHVTEGLKACTAKALTLLNRGIVDAEKQLRV